MKRFGIILLGIIAWGLLIIPGSAVAHTSHMGVHAQSPFDAPKDKKSLHCQLLGHRHEAALAICPHTIRDRSALPQLKADCGDFPTGAPVQIQWSKNLLLFPTVEKASSFEKRYFLASKQFHLPSPFVDLPEKPPQHA